MIKTIVYDLDDTLFPEKEFQKSGFKYIASWLSDKGFSISADDIQAVYARHPRTCFDELVRLHALPVAAQELVSLYREHTPDIHPYPHVLEVLAELQKRYTLAIITDHVASMQRNKIKALGLEPFFSQILCTQEMNTSKPDTAPFEKMKQLTDSGTGEIMYVGDNDHKDFVGARAAGYATVKYESNGVYGDYTGTEKEKADLAIRDHRDIVQIIEKLT